MIDPDLNKTVSSCDVDVLEIPMGKDSFSLRNGIRKCMLV